MYPKIEGLLGPFDISTEEWREYESTTAGLKYRIVGPVALYRRDGGTTHRVVDVAGVTHCVPCGVLHPDTVIRWKNKDVSVPVNF